MITECRKIKEKFQLPHYQFLIWQNKQDSKRKYMICTRMD